MSYLTRAIGAAKLFAKANAPTIMVTGGVVAMGAGAIMGAKKTLYLEDALRPHVNTLDRIEEGEKNESLFSYDSSKARSDRFKVYGHVGLDVTKLYFVPIVFFVGGAGLVFGGHRIMLQRNATLALAFTGLKQSFDAYRARVVQEYGPEHDQAFMNGFKKIEITDPETGEVREVASRDWDSVGNDPYNRIFEQGASSEWENDLGVNLMFLRNQQKFAQALLNRQKYLYLSDIYKALGFPENDISRLVGWKVTKLPDGSDNIPFVDFGLDTPVPDDWKYSKENAVFLDFNCQGLIIGGKVQKILEQA